MAIIKYIDIEFAKQPVLIPFYNPPPIDEDPIEELIQPKDVIREQMLFSSRRGYSIPPSSIYRSNSDENVDIQPSHTSVLKKVLLKDKEIYLQNEELRMKIVCFDKYCLIY